MSSFNLEVSLSVLAADATVIHDHMGKMAIENTSGKDKERKILHNGSQGGRQAMVCYVKDAGLERYHTRCLVWYL